MKPLLVVVSGPPGSGKSQLSEALAERLGLPIIAKDFIKETLMDALPVADRDASMQLGSAVFRLLFGFSASLLRSGSGAVLEAPFKRGRSQSELEALAHLSRMLLIHCSPPAELAVRRYRERFLSGSRHPGHFDDAVLDGLEQRISSGEYDPFELPVPILSVDTTDGYEPAIAEIVEWIRASARD